MAARMELILSTLSSFSIFWSVAVPIPKAITDQADLICCKFLWGDTNSKRLMHTISWDAITRLNAEGGLGICKVDYWFLSRSPKTFRMLSLKRILYGSDGSVLSIYSLIPYGLLIQELLVHGYGGLC